MKNRAAASDKVRRATDFLRLLVKGWQGEPGTKLPAVRDLALKAAVSRSTIWKAATILQKEQLITIEPRQGIRLGPPIGAPALPSSAEIYAHHAQKPSREKWPGLAARIKTDLHNRHHSQAQGVTMPSYKELHLRYGASFATITKALHFLCQDGFIEQFGRGFRIKPHTVKRTPARVIILNLHSTPGMPFLIGRTAKMINAFQSECTSVGLSTLDYGYWQSDNRFLFVDGHASVHQKLPEDKGLFGFCIVKNTAESGDYQELINRLSTFNKPIVVLDEYCDSKLTPQSSRGQVQVIGLDTTSTIPGLTVGRMLADLGHRHVAYFAPVYNNEGDSWAIHRFKGLKQAFDESGLHGAVSLFTPAKEVGMFDAFDRIDPLWRAEFLTIFKQSEAMATSSIPVIRGFGSKAVTYIFNRIHQECNGWNSAKLFEQALNHKEITAWVCSNDWTGLAALAYLKQHKIDVPNRLSLVAFDNDSYEVTTNLSSYEFDMDGAARMAVRYIVNPHDKEFAPAGRTIRVAGKILERGTIAEPEKKQDH